MKSIADLTLKIKQGIDAGLQDWGLILVIFLACAASFGLGRLSALENARPPVAIREMASDTVLPKISAGGQFEASKTGSVYYYPWCSGADKIAPGSQVWFGTEAAAQKAGYAPAKNCKG